MIQCIGASLMPNELLERKAAKEAGPSHLGVSLPLDRFIPCSLGLLARSPALGANCRMSPVRTFPRLSPLLMTASLPTLGTGYSGVRAPAGGRGSTALQDVLPSGVASSRPELPRLPPFTDAPHPLR
jgi:hypothetical protein